MDTGHCPVSFKGRRGSCWHEGSDGLFDLPPSARRSGAGQTRLPKGPESPVVPTPRRPRAHHIDLGVGVPHVADDAAVLHAIQVLPGHHVLVACQPANPAVSTHGHPSPLGGRRSPSAGRAPLVTPPPAAGTAYLCR